MITNVHIVVIPVLNVIKPVVYNVDHREYLIPLQNSVNVNKDFSLEMMDAWAVVSKDKFGSRQLQPLENVVIVGHRWQDVNNAN
jgi:hypothetical protein